MKCANCGSEVGADERFCRVCGTPTVSAVATPTGPPPLPDIAPMAPARATAPLAGPPPVPGVPPASSSAAPVGLIVAIVAGGLLMLCALGAGGFFVAKQMGLLGGDGRAGVVATNPSGSAIGSSTSSSVASTTASDPATQPQVTSPPVVNPAGTVLDLRSQPSDLAKAALRLQLLNAARKRLKTSSKFFVNQLWVDGDWAIGEIGAEKGGHRIWAVWKGPSWKLVWTGSWGVTDEMTLNQKVGVMPPELLRSIDWTKSWPAEFKFVP